MFSCHTEERCETMSEDLKSKDNFDYGLLEMQEFKRLHHDLEFYKSRDRQLEAILNTSDGIWICDGSGTILSINRASEEFNGIKADDFIGRNITYAAEKGMFDRSATLETIRAGREVAIVQYMTKKKRFLMVTGTPTFDEEGNISLVIVTERDMTQLNAMRDQLEETRMATEKYRDKLAELSMSELKNQEIIAESKGMCPTYLFWGNLGRAKDFWQNLFTKPADAGIIHSFR